MPTLIGLSGLFGFVVCLVIFIIAAIRKKPKKTGGIGMVVCFALFIVGLAITPPRPESPADKKEPIAAMAESSKPESEASEPASLKLTETPQPTPTPSETPEPAPKASEPPASEQVQSEKKEIQVDFSGKIEPTLLSVGDKLVFTLIVKNLSKETLRGFSVYGDGKWEDFTIANVMPSASYEKGILGWNFNSSLEVPSNEQRALNIILYPNKAGNYEFSFIPKAVDGSRLVDANGESIVIGGKVGVISK